MIEQRIERDESIARDYLDGQSLRAVGDRYGLSAERVRQILVASHVEIRDRGSRSPRERDRIDQRREQRAATAHDLVETLVETVLGDERLWTRIVRARANGYDTRQIARRYLLTPTVVERVLASVTIEQRAHALRRDNA